MQAYVSKGKVEGEEPAWAPLRDNYMLTSSRLKRLGENACKIKKCIQILIFECYAGHLSQTNLLIVLALHIG